MSRGRRRIATLSLSRTSCAATSRSCSSSNSSMTRATPWSDLGVDVAHALDRRERLLERRRRPRPRSPSGDAPSSVDADADERELDVRVAVDAEAQEAEHAERGERERHHPGEDGPLDREVGEAHSSAPLAFARRPSAATARGSAVAHGHGGAVDEPAVAAPHHAVARRDVAAHLDAAVVVDARSSTATRCTRSSAPTTNSTAPSLRWISASSGTITHAAARADAEAHAREQARPQVALGVVDLGLDPQRARGGVDGGRDERHDAVEDAVRERAPRDVDAAGRARRARCRAR